MQSYKLPSVKELPEIIPIDYKYIGDRRPQANIPENFRTDFPDYVWHRFSRLKGMLNSKKAELDRFVTTPEKSKKFTFVSMHAKSMMSLKQNKMITEYNSEIKSNAFLKMYEIMRWLDDYNYLNFCDKTPKKTTQPKIYKTLSIAEAPGNFILALNHFIKTECPDVIWKWRASTFRVVAEESGYLADTYGIIKRFPQNWIYGVDGDGDITSVNNLQTFEFLDSDFPQIGKKYNLMTSDVKYVPNDNIYSEEENINLPVVTGHTLASLINLEKGGITVLKQFSLFECGTISLLYLLSYCFNHVYITKPSSSKQANSEVYIVCVDFLNNLNSEQMNQLKTYLTWIRFLNIPKKDMVLPAIFRDIDVDEDWFSELIKFNKDLTERQIKELDEMVEIVDKYFNNPHLNAQNDFRLTNERLEDRWIKENKVKRIADQDKLMVVKEERSGGRENKCSCGEDVICVHKNQIRAILNAKSEYFRKACLEILSEHLPTEKVEELLAMYRQKSDTELYNFIISNSKTVPKKDNTISPEKLINFNQNRDFDQFMSDEKTCQIERFYLNDERLQEFIYNIFDQNKTLILNDVDVDVLKSKNSQLLFDISNILKNFRDTDLRPIYKTYHYPRETTEDLIHKIVSNYGKKTVKSEIERMGRKFRITLTIEES
jgi:hypothetical protein